MLTLIKLLFCFLLLCLAFGSVCSIVIFAVDVLKWHDKESKVSILPSASEELTTQSEQNTSESEVISNAYESGQHNTSAVPFSGSES